MNYMIKLIDLSDCMDILPEFDKCGKGMYFGDVETYRKHAGFNRDTICVHDNEFQLTLMALTLRNICYLRSL